MHLIFILLFVKQSFLMSATNQLFGVCDSSGAQKSTVSSPQSVEAVPVDGIVNGKPPLNQSSKSSCSNQTATGQVDIESYEYRIFPLSISFHV